MAGEDDDLRTGNQNRKFLYETFAHTHTQLLLIIIIIIKFGGPL